MWFFKLYDLWRGRVSQEERCSYKSAFCDHQHECCAVSSEHKLLIEYFVKCGSLLIIVS